MTNPKLDFGRKIRCRLTSFEVKDQIKTVFDIREGSFGERAFLRHVKELLTHVGPGGQVIVEFQKE